MTDDIAKTVRRSNEPAASTARGPDGPGAGLPVQHVGRYAVPDDTQDPELGRGGMGRVLRLRDDSLQREVAVKELLPEHVGSDLSELFIREARVLARLEHPGVVPVYELGRREDGTLYYSMKRVRGRSLADALHSAHTLEERLALLPHFIDVAQTIGFAHSRGVIHRDLKPDNVMVGEFGETQVLDWGLALVDSERTQRTVTAGTPAYMSPEQAAGDAVDARTDVWALGVMLFELLTGALPFNEPTGTETMNAVRSGRIPTVKEFEPRAPRALVAVVEHAMQRTRADRYENAGAFAEALLKTRAEQFRAPVAVLAGLVAAVAVALGALSWGISLRGKADEAVARGEYHSAEALGLAAQSLAEASRRALEAGDVVAAGNRAREALALRGEPLARGVLLLAQERGVPQKAWSVTTEAGCSALVAVKGTVACATLNQVLLFSGEEGTAMGTLSLGPRGWQHALTLLDDGRLASAGDDRAVHVWDLPTLKEARTVGGFDATILSLQGDGPDVLVGLRTGAVVRVTPDDVHHPVWKHPAPVTGLAASSFGLASASLGLLKVWPTHGTPLELDRAARALAWGPDGSLSAGVDRSVLTLREGAVHLFSTGHEDEVTAVAAGGWLWTGSRDGTVRWWRDERLEGQLSGFAPGVQALVVDAERVIVATRDRRLEAWTVPAPKRARVETGEPTVAQLTARGALYEGLRDGRVQVLEPGAREATVLPMGHTGSVRALAVDAAGDVLSGAEDGLVQWLPSGGIAQTLERSVLKVSAVAVSADGAHAAWARDDGSLVLFNLPHRRQINVVHEDRVISLAFSPDGHRLAAGRDDKRVELYDAQTLGSQGALESFLGPVSALAWSPDSSSLLTGDGTGQVRQWTASSLRIEHAWSPSHQRIVSLDLQGDDGRLAVGSEEGDVVVLTQTGAEWARVPARLGDALAVRFGTDGRLLAYGTERQLHQWVLSEAR
jgi:WD40 repeat protein